MATTVEDKDQDFLKDFIKQYIPEVEPVVEPPKVVPETGVNPLRKKWSTISAQTLKTASADAPPALIPGLVPSSAVVTFAGAPGIGKSFTTLSWAACLATGTPWFGRKVAGPSRVVYVLGEGWTRFGRRVSAWEEATGVTVPDNLEFVDGASGGINLLDPLDVQGAIDVFTQGDNPPALIVFDTFSMLAAVKSENDNSEVSKVFAGAHRLSRATGATVMLVHHVSKGEGLVRGATAFKGNADTVIVAGNKDADKGGFWLSTRGEDDGKQRDGEGEKVFGLRISQPGVLTMDGEEGEKTEARAKVVEGLADLMAAPQPQPEPTTLCFMLNCENAAVKWVNVDENGEGFIEEMCASHAEETKARFQDLCSVVDITQPAA